MTSRRISGFDSTPSCKSSNLMFENSHCLFVFLFAYFHMKCIYIVLMLVDVMLACALCCLLKVNTVPSSPTSIHKAVKETLFIFLAISQPNKPLTVK